jgi:hypothetical protein
MTEFLRALLHVQKLEFLVQKLDKYFWSFIIKLFQALNFAEDKSPYTQLFIAPIILLKPQKSETVIILIENELYLFSQYQSKCFINILMATILTDYIATWHSY